MRGGGGQKMSVFVHAQGIKTVQWDGEGCQKMEKFYNLIVDKNKLFGPPSPPHLVHVVIE